MPLTKSTSKAAFSSNIKNEYEALRAKGKSKKKAVSQAAAIAYSVKRRAGGGKE